MAIVEVRTRGAGAWTSALGSIDGLKRYRLRLAAQRLWSRRYRDDPSVRRLRIDVASVTLAPEGARIEYIKAAF